MHRQPQHDFAQACRSFVEARHPKPLLPLSIFRAGDLAVACLALAALIGGVGGIFVICSMYMQNGLNFSAARSGLGMLPVALATIASGQCAPVFMKRLKLRTIALAGLGLEVAGLLLLALSSVTGRYALSIAPFAFLSIFGSSSAFMALMGLATGGLKPEQQGTGSALLFTGQQIGLPLGVAVTLAAFKAAIDPSRLTALEPYRAGVLIPVGFAGLSLLVTLLVRRQGAPPADRAAFNDQVNIAPMDASADLR